MDTYRDLVARARARITEVSPAELAARREVTVIDVREIDEHNQGTIPGARHVARGTLERDIGTAATDPDTPIVLFCASGARSALAAASLLDMGFTDVSSLAGGFEAWKREGHEWRPPQGLDADQRIRYSRHIRLPEVGTEGQQQLLESRVLIVGAGGLGSPAAIYLAAAGVGTIGIVDPDVVDVSNLQRQVIHDLTRVGMPKVDSAADAINALNPDVKVVGHRYRLDADNAVELLGQYDVIVDGSDNFPTRYLINDASLHTRKPVVHGSIFRFEGQVAVFDPYNGPCYRCLFPEPPPPELAPSCDDAGVFGVLPGIVGTMQAAEAIKLVLGVGETLAGRLLAFDALDQSYRTVTLDRDPSCPACADPDHPPVIVEYDATCAPAGHVARDAAAT